MRRRGGFSLATGTTNAGLDQAQGGRAWGAALFTPSVKTIQLRRQAGAACRNSGNGLQRRTPSFDDPRKTPNDGRLDTRRIKPLQGQQFGRVAVFDEHIGQAQLQYGAHDAQGVEGFGHGTACATLDRPRFPGWLSFWALHLRGGAADDAVRYL